MFSRGTPLIHGSVAVKKRFQRHIQRYPEYSGNSGIFRNIPDISGYATSATVHRPLRPSTRVSDMKESPTAPSCSPQRAQMVTLGSAASTGSPTRRASCRRLPASSRALPASEHTLRRRDPLKCLATRLASAIQSSASSTYIHASAHSQYGAHTVAVMRHDRRKLWAHASRTCSNGRELSAIDVADEVAKRS